MSLQVWLPLNGNLDNQGLNILPTAPSYTNMTFSQSGKIGKYYGQGKACWHLSEDMLDNEWSVALWYYNSSSTSTDWSSTGNSILFCKNSADMPNAQIYLSIFQKNKLNICANDGSNATALQYQQSFAKDKWYHFATTYDGTNLKLYMNGNLVASKVTTAAKKTGCLNICIDGRATNAAGTTVDYGTNGLYNDVRLYSHAISEREVKMLSQALVLHYPLSAGFGGAENLFRDSAMGQHAIDNMVDPFSTDWTKYFRYYNGAIDNHSFSDGIDTITLASGSNIGIAFCRKATDIALDSSSYYTISCEAKCEISGAHLDIGLSYYNTSNAWVWRGGTNPQNFTAVDTWQKFTFTFKPDANTQYIMYCFTIKNTTGKHFSIKHCKLEKGSVATPWTMNSGDVELADIATTEYDVSGYNNHGTKNGDITYSSDSARYAVCSNFNGTNSYIEANPLPAETKTISIWVKTSWVLPPSGFRIAVHDKISGLAIGWTTGMLITRAAVSGNGSTCSPTGTYIANKWNHIVVVKTSDTTRNIYINGQLMNTAVNNWWGADLDKLDIGIRHYNGYYTGYFDGQLSDFRAYATALTEADVKELYNTAASLSNNGTLFAYEYVEA